MYSKKQFTALEAMCRELAALARSEMEYSLMQYWLAEAEEWKQLRQPALIQRKIAYRSQSTQRTTESRQPARRNHALINRSRQ
jgi:uncharacterized protein YdaU (DUF1376 family)